MKDSYEYSTHQPVLNFFIRETHLQTVVEVGIGDNSSHLFWEYPIPELIHIENDLEWINKIKKTVPKNISAKFIHHKISDRINDQGIKWRALNEAEKKNVIDFYTGLTFSNGIGFKLLFVDGYACCRMKAMEILKSKFDFIVYHDAEPIGEKANDYNFSKGFEDFTRYILKSPRTWTGFLVRKSTNVNISGIFKEIKKYEKDNSIKMELYYEVIS